jgi:hypothetical protein
MGEMKKDLQADKTPSQAKPEQIQPRLNWETPKMEDVSEQVMAQPYIRFT